MRRWRKMTWALILWTVFLGIWIAGGIASADTSDCAPTDQLCKDASNAGTGIGVALLVFLWGFGFIILSLVWFMSRPKP